VHSNDKQQMLSSLCSHEGPRTFLLSYPRSGNTWLRYCLEFLTQRPTFSRIGLYHAKQQPIAWSAGFDIDLDKPIIEKIHAPRELGAFNIHADKLILLLRNPKEQILRLTHHSITALQQDRSIGIGYRIGVYFDNIALYDKWPKHMRLCVYYEDLLTSPRETLSQILLFLDEPLSRLDSFMRDYEYHKQRAITFYRTGSSNGIDLLFHSRKVAYEHRQKVELWLVSLWPEIWDRYLQCYAEERLIY
jgi:hypothetical protein